MSMQIKIQLLKCAFFKEGYHVNTSGLNESIRKTERRTKKRKMARCKTGENDTTP